MSEAPLMVGVSGLRGIVGQSLTPEVAARFGGALGAWLREKGPRPRRPESARRTRMVVAVGRDGRVGGNIVLNAAIAGLAAAGCDVIACDVAMTPSMAVFVDMCGASAGLICTASHNPQEWNGLKIVLPDHGAKANAVSACAPAKAIAEEIIALFRSGAPTGVASWKDFGRIEASEDEDLPGLTHLSRLDGEVARLASTIRKRKYRVVLDCVGGSGAVISPGYLRERFGCRVHVEGDYTDGRFTHTPEPTRENLSGLRRQVKKHKAHVGFAQDPDADRLAIVDEKGRYIGEEYTLALCAEALLAETVAGANRRTGKRDLVLVTNLSTSRMIEDVAARYGARVVRTAVGEANVVEAMKNEAAAGHRVIVGGEGNGGVIWPRVTYVRDSLASMSLVLGLMARRGESLSEIVDSMPSYAIEKRKVDLARKEDANPAVEKLAVAFGSHRIDRQDGVRVDFTHGPLAGKAWLHVRASNTEPIMRLIAEAPSVVASREILDQASNVISA